MNPPTKAVMHKVSPPLCRCGNTKWFFRGAVVAITMLFALSLLISAVLAPVVTTEAEDLSMFRKCTNIQPSEDDGAVTTRDECRCMHTDDAAALERNYVKIDDTEVSFGPVCSDMTTMITAARSLLIGACVVAFLAIILGSLNGMDVMSHWAVTVAIGLGMPLSASGAGLTATLFLKSFCDRPAFGDTSTPSTAIRPMWDELTASHSLGPSLYLSAGACVVHIIALIMSFCLDSGTRDGYSAEPIGDSADNKSRPQSHGHIVDENSTGK